MPVLYNGKKIIPAPFFTLTKNYLRSETGEKIGVDFTITLTGTIVADQGSPASVAGSAPDWDENFWIAADYPPCEDIAVDERLGAILRKQEALRCLFAEDGKTLEIQPPDDTPPLTCNPKVISLEFESGIFIEKCNYSITLQAERVYGVAMCSAEGDNEFDDMIQSCSEEWVIEFNDVPQDATDHHTFRVTHNLSAVGKLTHSQDGTVHSQPWEHAKAWVEARDGFDSTKTDNNLIGVPAAYNPYNHVRSETIGELSGTYSLSETWILSKGAALEDFNVSTRSSAEDGITVVSIEGSVSGLEVNTYPYSVSSSKYTNAVSKFATVSAALHTRAENYSDVELHVIPKTSVVGRNPVTGVITYSYEYDNRPSNCVENSISEVITITDIGAGDVFAEIPIIAREAGPILQDICTVTSTKRQLSIEVIMPQVDSCVFADWLAGKPDVTAIVAAVKPVATQVFTGPPQESWTPRFGRYSYSVEWTYQ